MDGPLTAMLLASMNIIVAVTILAAFLAICLPGAAECNDRSHLEIKISHVLAVWLVMRSFSAHTVPFIGDLLRDRAQPPQASPEPPAAKRLVRRVGTTS